jgi:hypothetical protein
MARDGAGSARSADLVSSGANAHVADLEAGNTPKNDDASLLDEVAEEAA